MPKGLNLQSVKSRNKSMVLYLLGKHGALSRKELSARLSLTPAGLTKICAELIEDGYVYEIGSDAGQAGKSGRKEIMLALKLDDKYAFGINAERGAITYSLSRLDGTLIEKRVTPFCADVAKVAKAGAEFLEKLDGYRDRIVGAGVCIIGATSDKFGVWRSDDLQAEFERALKLPVAVENNVKAFAESELIYGDIKSHGSVLFFKWGAGVGSSIVANGRVLAGNDSGTAEIGHYIVNPRGAECRCGRRGCLETEVSADAILSRFCDRDIDADSLATCDDAEVLDFILKKTKTVAPALVNTATIMSADEVILFGAMFESGEIAEALIRNCAELGFSPDLIKISSQNPSRAHIGATAICAKKFFFERK